KLMDVGYRHITIKLRNANTPKTKKRSFLLQVNTKFRSGGTIKFKVHSDVTVLLLKTFLLLK
ncbi:hypothetical protein COI41_30395, partial [Bacillus toyonensis]